MIRVAVISDSHGGKLHLERFVRLCETEKFDQIVHLGDGDDDIRWLEKNLSIPIAAVAGNCDRFSDRVREAKLTLGGKRFLLTHGDKHGVKFGYDRLSYYAQEQMADVAMFGHTHHAFAAFVGPVLLINPGSLKSGSMCILEIKDGDIVPRIMDIDEWYDREIMHK